MRIRRHPEYNEQSGSGGLTCATVKSWIEQSKSLNNEQLTAYSAHLELCASCRRVETNEQLIRAVIVPHTPPLVSGRFNADLMTALGMEPAPAPRTVAEPMPVRAYAEPAPTTAKGSRRWRTGKVRGSRWIWLSAVATVVLFTLSLAIYYAGVFSKPLAVAAKGVASIAMNFTDAIIPIVSQFPLFTQWLPFDPMWLIQLLMIPVTLTLAMATVGWVSRR